MFVTNGRSKKEGRGKKEEGVNIEKKIDITISNELEELFLSISDQYLPFCSILFSRLVLDPIIGRL
ncbi:MAG: hypothetical protein F6K54_11200 [Okeania sp. SIO3B5]|uniref:hypothetical protein n=1 Tax=Okeania sp. SIO3B5 TaxID=2607811 RepID=UPI0014012559|nr:hypothetical protein [Okeania sp. SIO3B5]NEO53597.1 hypothetical protein [Okeania sp. SIO3B5]